MILPIVSAISREVIATVPAEHKEAALALGATRWEMIRMAVLPYSRAGITGAAMLGLGRAIGETIAVTLVIGNAPRSASTIFAQGYTLAAVIANEFGEAASDPLHRAALIAAGLVLFVLTLIVNAIARDFVARGPSARQRRRPEGNGRMSAHDAPAIAPDLARRRRRTDTIARGVLLAATLIALVPLVLVIYYLLKQGPRRDQLALLHDRPDRPLPRRPGRHQEAILGTIEIVALATADRGPARHRRRALPRRVRQERPRSPTSSATSST